MAETSLRYRGLESHACARCAKEGVWSQLTWLYTPVPGKPMRCYVQETEKHLFRDDTKLTRWVKEHGIERPVEKWVHRYTTMCQRCNRVFNRETYTVHDFADYELPLDYWADHEANVALMRARGIDEKRIEMHEQLLARLGIRRES